MKGKFISFEGGEGTGKTTQVQLLSNHLNKLGIDNLTTYEIGGTNLGKKIKNIIMNTQIPSMSELMLFISARYDHINNVIIPALKKGIWVICDRYVDSSAAYQSIDHKISMKEIYNLHKIICENLLPDITFLLDLSPETAINRVKSRGNMNKFDAMDANFYQNIRNNFLEIANIFSDRVSLIDANNNSEIISNNINNKLSKQLKI